MDPQQRILLQLTWEALEDAGIRPFSIAKSDVGVFIGASQTDYGHAFFGDHAIADAQFATGTAVAILANRVSYVYDLAGPSLTVDTACSSSLVALHQAVEALQSGRIETAIVGGTNAIASPASFIAFSQANMLSPTGLCQAFSAKADGFVRAEGAVVLVLRKASYARMNRNPIHGIVLASDVNSDGRTSGIALPNVQAQEALLRRIYSRKGIDLDRLAFVEAHGTGTPVGDPVEATAIGRSLGRERSSALPIGSIKTNIGHLEPASGLAGVLKALLALNHGILPPSLHFTEPNPNIDFKDLNLTVCDRPLLLAQSVTHYAGVNSFGFGGTNAHVVLAGGEKTAPAALSEHKCGGANLFALSANSSSSLLKLAQSYVERIVPLSDQDTATLASAIMHRREHLSNRVVVSSTRSQDVVHALKAYIAGETNSRLTTGTSIGEDLPVAFVYSGNGSQWVGMGHAAYRNNAQFRTRFDQVDSYFKEIGGWSLKDALFSATLKDRLALTSIAQPLIFAIQVACTAALRAGGLRPAAVLGHSVGEVAAAEAAGILDLRTATKVIHFRSTHQELIKGAGRMAAVLAPYETARQLAEAVGNVEIAAINSPRAITVAGPTEALAAFKGLVESRGIALLDLDLDYPFHTTLMAPIELHLTKDLDNLTAHEGKIPFVSTVTGDLLGARMGSRYWWRNVREPVQFMSAVRAAAKLGTRYFVEIGPRGMLLKHIADSLQGEVNSFGTLAVLDRSDEDVDPFDKTRAKALVSGAQVDIQTIFGQDPGPEILLPHYPWHQTQFRFRSTPEAIGAAQERHPLAGSRYTADSLEWYANIDTELFPKVIDHKVGEQIIFPGTGFLEIALSVASQWLQSETTLVTGCEFLNPLDLTNGETHELMTRISAGSNTFEIFSRPRLSQVGWLLHCRGKIAAGDAPDTVYGPDFLEDRRELDAAAIYRLAEGGSLNYGPAFRLVRSATVHASGQITVELAPQNEATPFLLDPMRLDACAHGFFTLFPELRAEERGVTYIPVRIEETVLYRPHSVPNRAVIEVISKSERSILANCYAYGSDGEIIAVLRGVRSQAVPIKRKGTIDSIALVERLELTDGSILGRTGVPVDAQAFIAEANRLGLAATDTAATDSALLLEGWATAAAYEIASALAESNIVDVDLLIARGLLPEDLRSWLINALFNLEAAELATREGDLWQLVPDPSLPKSASVVKALAAEHPSRAAELPLAATISGFAEVVTESRKIAAPHASVLPDSALDFYNTTNVMVGMASDTLFRILRSCVKLWPKERALRILQIGYGPLIHSLASLQDRAALLTVFEPDRRRYENASVALSKNSEVMLIDEANYEKLGTYDLIVAVGGLHRLPSAVSLGGLKGMLAPNGLLAAVEPNPSLFRDFVLGFSPSWFTPSSGDRPMSPLLADNEWTAALRRAGFHSAEAMQVRCGGSEDGCLLVADAGQALASGVKSPSTMPDKAAAVLVAPVPVTSLTANLVDRLASNIPNAPSALALSELSDSESGTFILAPTIHGDYVNPVDALTQRCLEIKACAEAIGSRAATLWLIFSGALDTGMSRLHPVERGAWAFSRTLANEFQKLDVRRIDVDPRVPADLAAEQIYNIVTSATDETELHLDGSCIRVVRVRPLNKVLDQQVVSSKIAARLERRSSLGQRLSWAPVARKRPGAREVEIEVVATGVNFRDLMWTLGLLPEDMLEDGFTGPSLGLECAGRIVRVGSSVNGLQPGDRVLAFAASSFSSYVTVQSSQVMKLPKGISCEAAATIPVAFLTAYYSLVTLAKLRKREWVLIHGGAGGVGMAAIQIAQLRGARVIATAGSPSKRAMLRALGVDHVFDSRSTSFVDDVRALATGGVDVVLNSLAGAAMERSIACLRPFGRFVELGKRDYVFNTHVGLRPFRKNLSYFGVDVDQLIVGQKALGRSLYSKIISQIVDQKLTPLPFTVFDAASVSEAFHLMQQSGHVGKILVRPPSHTTVRPEPKRLQISAKGTHVITGAFGGFGLETVKWLVERGARHLVMIGRRGATLSEATVVDALKHRGVAVLADPCDVADRKAVERLFQKIHTTMPPVVGVLHEAMVLDDAILSNLDADRFHRVLAPKVAGAENLDIVTRGLPLNYFVLFSSVTTLIGNPGQGNYVAANAYMEGLARRRRQEGLPALAIGWGPIIDVGAVARDERLQRGLQKLTGVTGMRAREALQLMAEALEQQSESHDGSVMTISPNDGSFGSNRLAALRSPTYANFIRQEKYGVSESTSIDLRALAAREGVDAARRKVIDVIATQLAHVLHSRDDAISRTRPLGEIGLDSLMALELVMSLEESFGIRIPLVGASGSLTIISMADQIISHFRLASGSEDVIATTMAEQHQTNVEASQIEALKEFMSEETLAPRRLLS